METIERLGTYTKAEVINARSLDWARYASSLFMTRPSAPGFNAQKQQNALRYFAENFPHSMSRDLVVKALTNPGTIGEPAWAAPLAVQPSGTAFLAYTRPSSLEGQLFASGARKVPFHVSIPVQTAGGTYAWVGEGAPKPVGNLRFAGATLPIHEVGRHPRDYARTREARGTGSDTALRDELGRGNNAAIARQMLSTDAPIAGVSPGGLLYNVPSFGSAGSSSAHAQTDVKQLIATYFSWNPDSEQPVLIMSAATAAALALATGSQSLTMSGGSLYGIKTIVTAAAGPRLIMLDAGAVLIADDDGIDIDISTQASVELADVVTSPPTAATPYVSLFQADLVGYRTTRIISWKLARPTAAAFSTVAYA